MDLFLDAACYCNTGRVRKNNEDNFFFDGRCLEAINKGLKHPVTMMKPLRGEECLAVFDGMGGENYGELASFAAADCMQRMTRGNTDYYIPERKFLEKMCGCINEAVLEKQREMRIDRMGSTMVALYFSHDYVYLCNLGDSRAYRLRDREFMQLSVDHVEKNAAQAGKKAPLTQHLGIDPEEFLIEPYIAKGELKHGDQYLLCSDGLTDMLSNLEIDAIMTASDGPAECVKKLVDAALEKGGKDNVTVIICRII